MSQQECTSDLINPVELVVLGASSGGLDVLIRLLQLLPKQYLIPTVAILHQRPNRSSGVPEMLAKYTHMRVHEPEDKQQIESGCFYVAPPNYHLLFESDKSFSLSLDAPLNYCRPSIDMALITAADVYRQSLLACILTGANSDGAEGARYVKAKGGSVLVQDPNQATVDSMPRAAIAATTVNGVLELDAIADKLVMCALGDGL